MINKPTCYKNPKKTSCIDLILTNYPHSFQNPCIIETGLSDFRKMFITVMKTTFGKMEPKVIKYRNFYIDIIAIYYNSFCNDTFRDTLQNIVSRNLEK